jgi:translation initiation factor 6
MMKISSYNGNAYLGVYCVANESLSFVPLDSSDSFFDDVREGLDVQVEKATVAGANILGALIAMNSYGAVVSNMTSNEELESLSRYLPVCRLEDRLNASGNNILVNDNAALVHADIGKTGLRQIKETLQVETVQGSVGGYKTVGSICVATNKGILCHPTTSPDDLEMLKSLFKVPASIGTLNYGAPMVGACMIANSKGAAIGFKSTPIELGRVEDALLL